MIKGMTLPKGGSRLPLILGLVLGLVTAVLVVVVLSSSEEKTSSGPISVEDGKPVVVAARDLPAGTKLTAGDLKTVGFAEVPFGSFGVIDEAVVGKITDVLVVQNEPVLESKLGGATCVGGSCPLTTRIDFGQRAVSVAVSSLIGAGGNIRPGDFVDVVLIVEVKPQDAAQDTSGTSDQFAATILQNIKVLAIDQSITNPNADTTDPNEGGNANEAATTLTLQVTPTQGEVLAMADVCGANHGGRLAVSLRAPGDTNGVPGRNQPAENGPPPTCSGILGIQSFGE